MVGTPPPHRYKDSHGLLTHGFAVSSALGRFPTDRRSVPKRPARRRRAGPDPVPPRILPVMGELFHFPANYKGFLVTLSFGGHLARDLFKFAIFGGISHPFLDPDQVLAQDPPRISSLFANFLFLVSVFARKLTVCSTFLSSLKFPRLPRLLFQQQ